MDRSARGTVSQSLQEERPLVRLLRSLRAGARREMAAAIAHELSQPIGVILTYATSRPSPHSGDSEPGTMAMIAAEANRATESLRTLKAAVRRRSARWRATDLNELLRATAAIFEDELAERSITLRLELAEPLPPVQGDGERLAQAFLSLVENALEAMAEAAAPRELRVRSERLAGGEVEIRFCDTGTGLPAGVTERLFERFFTTRPEGLGMGLAISRSIVEAHGGRLWATANPERGATFAIRLPIEEGENDDAR
ncbi:MAG: sensor histidine kinase [Candidatus Binatia bacterium]